MKRTNQIKTVIKYIMLILIPALLFYLEAFFTYNPFVRTRWKAQVLNIIFLEALMLLLWMVIGSAVWALRIETMFVLIAGIANYYVISFRGNPIVPWDFLSLKTAASVAGEYSYTLGGTQIVLILILLGLLGIEHFVKLPLKKNVWNRKAPLTFLLANRKRLLAAVLSLAAIFGLTYVVSQEENVTKLNLYPFLFTPNVMYERNGFAVTFLMDLQYLKVEKPAGYNAKEVKELLDSYNKEYSWQGDSASKEKGVSLEARPNLIVVMNEAFSDVGILGDFSASEDYLPFYHELAKGYENTITGHLHVSVKGGNTANTEYEFLTGNTMTFLPAGSIPYQQYVNGEAPSLASYLKQFGYQTYAMHPYYATGWNRDNVYPWFGFDSFLDQTDFPNATYLRGYVDDASCVNKIIELYEQKTDAPLFLFNVTMQNHSPYTDGYQDAAGNIEIENTYSPALSEYLTLMKKSDAALQSLLAYFEKQDEPTVIVFFGDHQPTDSVVSTIYQSSGKNVSALSEEEEAVRYEVPFVIWANYDIPEKTEVEISTNYLGAYAMAAAGMPLADYQEFLLELQEMYPVISTQSIVNVDGKWVDGSDDAINQYRKLQYYLLFE